MEEGGARGKAGTGDGSGARGSRGAELRAAGGPNRDMVLWRWEAGAAPATGAAVEAEVGTSGCVRADMVL